MLEELDWLSVNQMSAQTRLMEAWKAINLEDYCMKDTLKIRSKGAYRTRSSNLILLDHGNDGLHTGFVNPTSKIWNRASAKLEGAKTPNQAKNLIREYVKENIPA